MRRCNCDRCRGARERWDDDDIASSDVLAVLAIVLLFVVLFMLLPIGAW